MVQSFMGMGAKLGEGIGSWEQLSFSQDVCRPNHEVSKKLGWLKLNLEFKNCDQIPLGLIVRTS